MKNSYWPLFLLLTLLFGSCTDDDDMGNNSNLGLLTRIEGYVNGSFIDETTELAYDENQRLVSLEFTQGNFLNVTYEVTYQEEEIVTLTRTQRLQNGADDVVVYDVDYQNDQIILTRQGAETEYIFSVTGGFVDTFISYFGPDNEFFYESVFKRDQNNNIDSIFYYATNESDTGLLVWEYSFSDFDNETELNSAFNPVYNYSFSLYQPYLGAVLNLKLSNEIPLRCSYRDSNGNFQEDYVTAAILTDENGLVRELSYGYADLPMNDYLLEFNYD